MKRFLTLAGTAVAGLSAAFACFAFYLLYLAASIALPTLLGLWVLDLLGVVDVFK